MAVKTVFALVTALVTSVLPFSPGDPSLHPDWQVPARPPLPAKACKCICSLAADHKTSTAQSAWLSCELPIITEQSVELCAGRSVQSDNWRAAQLWLREHARLPGSAGQSSEAKQHSLG